MELKKPELSGSTLKMIALVTMLIDHIGAVIVQRTMSMPGFDHDFWSSLYWPLRSIGRLAFPIFAYMIAEGCLYTKNRLRYLLVIAGFAVGYQLVYFVVIYFL